MVGQRHRGLRHALYLFSRCARDWWQDVYKVGRRWCTGALPQARHSIGVVWVGLDGGSVKRLIGPVADFVAVIKDLAYRCVSTGVKASLDWLVTRLRFEAHLKVSPHHWRGLSALPV